ncbi:MAG: hypothetical protein GY789_06910 [Hyphomicrobiales bacterium]|nr:hypothetical protein [Hyphomicrobiales bacterium]
MTVGIYGLHLAGQMYIGSSMNIEGRFSAHKSFLRYGTHRNGEMQRLYDDGYHITHEVLLECEEEDLLILEQASLDRHKPSLNANLIAKRPSLQQRAAISQAKKGSTHSPESRARVSASNTGKRHSPEACAKIGAANRGRKHTPETRAKMSAAATGRMKSPETRAKISAASKGKKHSPEACANMKAAWAKRKNRGSDRIPTNDGRDPV